MAKIIQKQKMKISRAYIAIATAIQLGFADSDSVPTITQISVGESIQLALDSKGNLWKSGDLNFDNSQDAIQFTRENNPFPVQNVYAAQEGKMLWAISQDSSLWVRGIFSQSDVQWIKPQSDLSQNWQKVPFAQKWIRIGEIGSGHLGMSADSILWTWGQTADVLPQMNSAVPVPLSTAKIRDFASDHNALILLRADSSLRLIISKSTYGELNSGGIPVLNNRKFKRILSSRMVEDVQGKIWHLNGLYALNQYPNPISHYHDSLWKNLGAIKVLSANSINDRSLYIDSAHQFWLWQGPYAFRKWHAMPTDQWMNSPERLTNAKINEKGWVGITLDGKLIASNTSKTKPIAWEKGFGKFSWPHPNYPKKSSFAIMNIGPIFSYVPDQNEPSFWGGETSFWYGSWPLFLGGSLGFEIPKRSEFTLYQELGVANYAGLTLGISERFVQGQGSPQIGLRASLFINFGLGVGYRYSSQSPKEIFPFSLKIPFLVLGQIPK